MSASIQQFDSAKLTLNIGFDALVRQNTSTVDVDFVTNGDILAEDCDVFQSCPSTNRGTPACDCVSKLD